MWYRWEGKDLVIHVRLQPRASRDEFAGVVGELLRVRVTAPPIDNRANLHLVEFLAAQFGIAKANIVLAQGHRTRFKVVRIRAPARVPAELEIDGPSKRR
jgi:uncharacterized protein